MALLEREAFLSSLSGLLVEARHGHGRLALVVGEAGIGKTSLVEAFCAVAPRATRLLWGTCDPVVPARPFTPIVDIAQGLGGDLRAALAGGDRDGVVETFLATLRREESGPAIVVLDDLHWADEATLELLRVVGRRVARMPALVIGTYRDHDVNASHPLRSALGDVPAGAMTEIRLPPLSVQAVERLAGRRSDAETLHAVTGGNPFFVTEVLAIGGDRVPRTVRDAVLARVGRLSVDGQRVVRAASVTGPRCDLEILLGVAGASRAALQEGTDTALLELRDGSVSFRHDLGRRAVLDALSPSERTDLHARALAVLREAGSADEARLARHAIGAGLSAAVLEYAPAAGRRAEALGAHREAVAFYGAAVDAASRPDDRTYAELLEALARECSATDDIPRALASQRAALALRRRLGDTVREGACLTGLSGILWLHGEGEAAMRTAEEAVELLGSTAPESRELARALAVLAQRQVVSGSNDIDVVASATRALELAERLADDPVAVHAMTSLGVAEIFLGIPGGWARLEASARRSRLADLHEETVRALINLVEAARDLRRYDLADRHLADARAYLEDHDFELYDHLLLARVAGLEVDTGRWSDAVHHARSLLDMAGAAMPVRVRALTVIGLVNARRGELDAWSDLDHALALAGSEPQDLLQLRAARAEAAWLTGDHARARHEATAGLELGDRTLSPWWWSELAFWGWKAGARDPLPHPDERPLWLQVTGRHAEAAAAWHDIGAPYWEALALSESEVEVDLRRALGLLNLLGARAMADRVVQRLRSLGATRIARGPRAPTRQNPAQLTGRQLEILGLIEAGLANAAIAERLVISPKTVDHHVSAILHKLAVPNRAAAAHSARALGVLGERAQDGERAPERWGQPEPTPPG